MPSKIEPIQTQVEVKRNKSFNEDPSQGIKLSWKNIRYSVTSKYSKKEIERLGTKEKYYKKEILKNQNGYVKSGETMFIMGSSGAGKTTLLNVLCDRLVNDRNHKREGDIMVNDSHPVTQADFGAYGAYVMQDDMLFPTLTCEEVIRFSAKLKTNLEGHELDKKVEEMLHTFSLQRSRDVL